MGTMTASSLVTLSLTLLAASLIKKKKQKTHLVVF